MQEIPQNLNKNNQLMSKLLILSILVIISWVATMFVRGIIQDRENNQETTTTEISEQWSRPQIIAGPVITIPIEKTSVTSTGEKIVNTTTLTLLPQKLSYESQIESQLLTRGVYDTPVYTSHINGSGNFDLRDIELKSSADTKILWDQAVVSINVSDTRGISSMFDLTLNNSKYQMLPSSEFSTLDKSGVHTNIAIDPDQSNYTFSFAMPLKGSREISFLPLGEDTDVALMSDWKAPSFTGEFLPTERNLNESGFEATWKITSYGKNLPQYWVGSYSTVDNDSLLSKAFGVGLYQEVDFYTMVDRSTKYSILFITLTFLTFFMYEVLSGLRIHPVQYLLVGMAIALFYLLLLSFVEIIGFLPAYLISTVAITTLITGYCFGVLKAKKRAFAIGGLLIALYAYLYILLQLEQLSLLFGSVLLFGVLTTVMYITRNLDWYSLNKINK
ncbi:cell envelope integrity protein CreD [Candidatus Nomurabacteria bacterium]|nr:cell envelope integrity protein CreD [Candidatus Kaiserbacteria bacterium]MCB9814463.1 cell envelope integrity protein CreD [Candidatus Nomurabacteria bacterium]